MSVFEIGGGRPLEGTVAVHGAKNSVLPVLAATLLARGEVAVDNCPHLTDVDAALDILTHLGCRVKREGDRVIVDPRQVCRWDIPPEKMRAMRSSVIFLGPLLARLGRAELSYPGGCELGPRPIDLHLKAVRALGALVTEEDGALRCTGENLTGGQIRLTLPSVGATENAMLSACGAVGTTTIHNAAREPEIVDLQRFLNAIGGRVEGAGGSVIQVEGGGPLHGGAFSVMGDRMAAATWLCAGAAAGGDVTVTGVDYRHVSTVTAALAEAGCRVSSTPSSVRLRRLPQRPLEAIAPVSTAPYPGFPTDAQAPLMGALARSRGTTIFVENMFASRYRHVPELVRMGAHIQVEGRLAVVQGVETLTGARLVAGDLRGGAALVVAALGAGGKSTLTGLEHVDRGYQDMDRVLRTLGADILRRDETELAACAAGKLEEELDGIRTTPQTT